MTKVITYGTYDLLHYGHIRLLKRAKALGDYLIVGVTSDDYDKVRGKINNQQDLMKRIAAVKALGIADEVIVEEYEGQKIDDIQKYDVDIFTVGSDWEGHFDYLKEYCKVIYLPRTEGISSTEIRSKARKVKVGIVGSLPFLIQKFVNESEYVNGIELYGLYSEKNELNVLKGLQYITDNYQDLLHKSDAVYILSNPIYHYQQIKKALLSGKHVLCESPITLNMVQTKELFEIAKKNHCILQEGMKTAYATAYQRMLLLLKGGIIGKVIDVDATCTSLNTPLNDGWDGLTYWGPTALLPVFQILGTEYISKQIMVLNGDKNNVFAKINFTFSSGGASVKAGCGVKSEGELIVSGTNGYVYIPSPWWKTDYFEIRYENPALNKRYFYQLDGEGIRNGIVVFLNKIQNGKAPVCMEENVSSAISSVIEDYIAHNDRYDLA